MISLDFMTGPYLSLIAFCVCGCSVGYAQMQTDDDVGSDQEVLILGSRPETTHGRKTGQSETVRPSDETRFDSITHLKRQSSVIAPETGRVSPSGFTVPRIRGQDVKLTDVYFEDVLLQDPYTGLPLIEDIDLRAFGALEIHQGVPPPEVPGLNPVGTLRYRFLGQRKNSIKLGVQAGEPFGSAAWTLGEYFESMEDRETNARIYGRHHQTAGRYRYYSDEGTPYNASDDTVKLRDNNDQRSAQAIPYFKRKFGLYTLQLLGWVHASSRGLPSMSVLLPSETRTESKGYLANVSISREFGEVGVFRSVLLSLSGTETSGKDQVRDPTRRFLATADTSDLQIHSRRGGLNLRGLSDSVDLFASYEGGQSSVQNMLGTRVTSKLRRLASTGSLGTRIRPSPVVSLEAKASGRWHKDVSTIGETAFSEEQSTRVKDSSSSAVGGSVGFHPGEAWGVYGQYAVARRLPSLIEEFGNGSSIRANEDVSSEWTRHREIGTSYESLRPGWRIGAALYEDATQDKIVFVPVMANAAKALNIASTQVRGMDLRNEITFYQTTLYLSFSRLYAHDTTRSELKRLPAIPERIFVGEIQQKFSDCTLRWFSRYRSEVYRDLSNTVELPGAWVHDVSGDYKIRLHGVEAQAGLAIRNVFNLMDVPISAPDTPDSAGRTAYSDLAGSPLPGRQWVLALSASI